MVYKSTVIDNGPAENHHLSQVYRRDPVRRESSIIIQQQEQKSATRKLICLLKIDVDHDLCIESGIDPREMKGLGCKWESDY